ncbi:hypothetical protein ACE2AJ_10790 [Aquihabitans daechungensis]|uniref:hypothetical protein n=1 Tax=Aquihabitans daechungensis TaxID=1052257 RepID=UPI003B9FC1CF
MSTVEDPQTAAPDSVVPAVASDATEARCPFPHGEAAEACPVPGVGAARPRRTTERSKADLWVWKVLRIKEKPDGVSEASANKAFQTSMLISAARCTLTYIVFPIIIPLLGILKGVEAPLGIVIGTFAIVCDTFTIRRFFAADHKYRWYFSAIALSIIILLFVLLAEDIWALFH